MTDTAVPAIYLRIGDEDRTSGSGGVLGHVNPVTCDVQAQIPLAGKQEVNDAVAKAVAAFEGWRRWRPEARRDLLIRLADLISEHADDFAWRAVLDGGTPLASARNAVQITAAWARYYAGWADKVDGKLLSTFDTRDEFSYTVPEPIGVVGIITTWNAPLISFGMKVCPALAAGNCVVVKPSEITPFAPDLFAILARRAGLPDGVLSVLPGTVEAGEVLVRHPKVEKISFTGGPATARKILAACAENLKPAVLELGGKSASLLFPDADIDVACRRAVYGTVAIMAGQGCAIPSRLIVHASIYDQVVEKVAAIASNLKVGNPLTEGVELGPVINAAARDRVLGMLDRVRETGSGRIVTGGRRCGGALAGGNYIEPTVIADVLPDSEIAQVEVFGPVLVVMKFETEEEGVELANSTPYGLASYIQSADVSRVHRLAERLKSGGVYVNGGTRIRPHTPFGGLGLSGFGKEGGRAGLDEYLRYKTVALA